MFHPEATPATPATPVDVLRSILSPSDSAMLSDADLGAMLDDLSVDGPAYDEDTFQAVGCVEEWA